MEWNGAKEIFTWKRNSIRRRLLSTGLFFLALALLTNTLAGYFYTRVEMKKAAAQLQSEVGSRVAYEVERFLRRKLERLQDVATSMSLYELGSESQRLLGLLLLKNDVSFTEIALLDEKGTEVLRVSERRVYLPSELSDQKSEELFGKAISGESYISPVHTSDRAEPYVTVSVPIKVDPRTMIGVLSAELNLKALWQLIGGMTFGRAGYAYLVDDRGNLIAHRDASQVLRGRNLGHVFPVKQFLLNPGSSDPNPGREVEGLDGEEVLSTYAPIPRVGWAVVLEEPVSQAFADLRRMQRFALVLLGAGLLVGAAIIVWVSDEITRPILQLRKSVEAVAKGELDHRVDIKSGDEIEQLADGFNTMAQELKNTYATLEDKVNQRTAELSTLYELTATVNQSLEMDRVLKDVIEKIREIFHFDTIGVFLRVGHSDRLELKVSHGLTPELAPASRISHRGRGIVGAAVEGGEPLIFEDIQNDPRYGRLSETMAAEKTQHKFVAVFPIKSKLESVGAVVCLGVAARRFTQEEVHLLSSITDQVGVAVEKASLFEQTAERARQLSALYEVTAAVNRSLEMDPVLQEVMEKVTEIFHFDATRIFLYNREMDEMLLRTSFESHPEIRAQIQAFRRGQGIVGRVAESGEAIIFEDTYKDPRYEEWSHTKNTKLTGFRFLAGFPIKTKLRTVGAMIFVGLEPRVLTSDEIQLVTSMTEQVGVAVENARLFEEVKNKTVELGKLNSEVQRHLESLKLLTSGAQKLSANIDLPRLADDVVRTCVEIFGISLAWLGQAEPDGRVLRLAHFPLEVEYANDIQARWDDAPQGQGSAGPAIRGGSPVVSHDITTEPAHTPSRRAAIALGFRSRACLPLITRDEPFGILILLSKKPGFFNHEMIELLQAYANQAAAALENARLFEEVKNMSGKLEALIKVNRDVAELLDREILLPRIAEEARRVLNVEGASFRLIEGDSLVRAGHSGDSNLTGFRARLGLSESITGKVIRENRVIAVPDVVTDPMIIEEHREILRKAGYHSFLGVPLRAGDTMIGALNLYAKEKREFRPEELSLITAFADQAAVAIQNANLFSEVRQKSRELEALVKLSRDMVALLDREVLLTRIAEDARKLLGVEGASFRLVERDRTVRIANAGADPGELLHTAPRGLSMSDKVIQADGPLIIRRLQEDPRVEPTVRDRFREAGYKTFLGIPLHVGGRVIGTLNLYSKRHRDFRPEEIQLVTAFADQSAVAIQNANLFADVKNKSIELEKLNQELQEANRAKADFLAAMSHELRTPLNVIMGNAGLTKDGFFGKIGRKQTEAMDKILRYSQMLLKLINDVLTLTKIDAKKMSLDVSTFHLEDVMVHMQAYMEQLNRGNRLKVVWKVEPHLPPLSTDALKLEEILQNLVGNAFKFTPRGRIEVRVRRLPHQERVEFAVADTGIGIEKDSLERIFEEFYQLKEAHTDDYSGVGLGLSIVKRYLDLMQGDIRVESKVGVGTTFTFTLPYSAGGAPQEEGTAA